MSEQRKSSLTHQEAQKRAFRGWETRRKNDPRLRNIHKTGFRSHEWRRPNGEVVPMHGFKDSQIEEIAPALHATDLHVNPDRRFHTEIKAKNLRDINGQKPLGATYTSRYDRRVPTVRKKYLEVIGHVPEEHWGHKNRILINKDIFDSEESRAAHHPAGVVAHELGHSLGPFGESGATSSEIQQAFQWQDKSPNKKGLGYKDWQKDPSHPMSSRNRAGTDLHEDFAETYRNLIGIPMETRHNKIDPNTGQVADSNNRWHWRDQNSSRRDFMLKYHLQSTAPTYDFHSPFKGQHQNGENFNYG